MISPHDTSDQSYIFSPSFQFFELLFSSIAAKLVASSITYPHEVLRARLQDGRGVTYNKKRGSSGVKTATCSPVGCATTTEPARLGLVAVFKDIVKREGVLSLWSGLRVSLFRIVPATASTFLAYEYISRYLHERTHL